jgi:dipeptidyl aminopeptidase/acylaminoacyl peptidase
MLVIHGGGGDKSDMTAACRRLASVGFLAAAINWYMQPAPAYPKMVQDAQLALSNVKHRADVDPARVGSMGVSAGGYLSMMLGTLDFPDKVNCVVSIAGPTDFTDPAVQGEPIFRNRFNQELFGPNANDQALWKQASPIAYVSPSTANMIFFRSVNDKLVPRSQFERMIAALAKVGKKADLIEINGQGAGHALQTNAATALKLWDDEKTFVDGCLHK